MPVTIVETETKETNEDPKNTEGEKKENSEVFKNVASGCIGAGIGYGLSNGPAIGIAGFGGAIGVPVVGIVAVAGIVVWGVYQAGKKKKDK